YVDYHSSTHIEIQLNIIKVNNQERTLFIEFNSKLNILHQLQIADRPCSGKGAWSFSFMFLIRNYP
ncbi:hypothetical protein EWJ91_15965, partial [Salmonella enterica subsp. enterica serovar Ouagadougou]|nr:hypothetical protein [Salmonella enterica subsp. enterica serovar Ouagadougou]